jgi:hypothetical protein
MHFKQTVFALVLATLAGSAQAVGSLADVTVYDRAENRVLPVYYHEGRYYVAGKPGNEYQVTIRNRQAAEIMAVVSVDGVNAVSGETAHWSQTGYVFGPHASYDIKGWRKSLQRVARFFFTEIDNSYAARTGRPENVGVIGVAVFRRKVEVAVGQGRLQESKPEADRDASASAGSRAADVVSRQPAAPAAAEKNLGTGHGTSESAPVRYTRFERASATPDEVITLYYDSARNLQAAGVIAAPRITRPVAFPGPFVPDPR